MKNITKYFAMLVIAGGVFSACSQQATEPEAEPTASETETMIAAESTESESMMNDETSEKMAADEEVDYTVMMDNFKFDVTQMEAEPGQVLKVKIENGEGTHDFVIDELDVKTAQMSTAGESEFVEIAIPADAEPGTEYEYYCSVGQHRQMGMVGTLTVK